MEPNILVIGDLILDHYIWGDCERISPEAPVQVVDVKRESLNLGGACNVANNLVSLGSCVWICGVAGCDNAGKSLKEALEEKGISTSGIFFDHQRPTTQKSRIIAGHQQVVRVDREERQEISEDGERFILDFVSKCLKDSHIACIVLSDYKKGVLSEHLTQRLITLAKSKHIKILADPKGRDYTKYRGATLLTPNKKEAMEATGISISDDESLRACLCALQKMCDLEIALVTLSEDGIAFMDADKKIQKIPTIAREVFDVTGAGDTVIASLAYMLASQEPISQSVYFANAAAAVVVSKIGSAVADKQEIFSYLKRNNLLESTLVNPQFLKIFEDHQGEEKCFHTQINKILKRHKPNFYADKFISSVDLDAFLESLLQLKKDSFRVVFTNGCFDILHFGHLDYLHKSRNLGDLLIVGLNSDESVKRLKGPSRPINSEEDRIAALCALECVDFVIVFNEETPEKLIQKIAPDVLVKGADYAGKEIAGSAFSKEVRLIDFVENKSTTNLIEKIKGSSCKKSF